MNTNEFEDLFSLVIPIFAYYNIYSIKTLELYIKKKSSNFWQRIEEFITNNEIPSEALLYSNLLELLNNFVVQYKKRNKKSNNNNNSKSHTNKNNNKRKKDQQEFNVLDYFDNDVRHDSYFYSIIFEKKPKKQPYDINNKIQDFLSNKKNTPNLQPTQLNISLFKT